MADQENEGRVKSAPWRMRRRVTTLHLSARSDPIRFGNIFRQGFHLTTRYILLPPTSGGFAKGTPVNDVLLSTITRSLDCRAKSL